MMDSEKEAKWIEDYYKKNNENSIEQIVEGEYVPEENEITAESVREEWEKRKQDADEKNNQPIETEEDESKVQRAQRLALKSERDFYLRRRYFLREFTHIFLDSDIYTRFDDYFAVTIMSSFEKVAFGIAIDAFLKNITSDKKAGVADCSLLDQELGKDFLCIQNKDSNFLPEYISNDEIEKYEVNQLKNKIGSMLLGRFITAEAYRYVIGILRNSTLTLEELKEVSLTFKSYSDLKTNYEKFSTFINTLLSRVIEANIDEVYFYDQVDDEERRLNILMNTVTNFGQIDRVVLDETLLRDLEVTKKEFEEVLNNDMYENLFDKLNEKFESNIDQISGLIMADVLILDFHLLEEECAEKYTNIKRSEVENLQGASLNYFTKGILDAIPALVIIRILMKRNNDVKSRVLARFEKYEASAKPSYLIAIKFLKYFVEHNAHKHIILMVYIARALCLSKEETLELSAAFALNNGPRLAEHFDDFYEAISPNYKYIK